MIHLVMAVGHRIIPKAEMHAHERNVRAGSNCEELTREQI
jgi:hypothetical protein